MSAALPGPAYQGSAMYSLTATGSWEGGGSQELELDPEVWVGVWHEQQPYRQDNSHLQIELAELPASGVNI